MPPSHAGLPGAMHRHPHRGKVEEARREVELKEDALRPLAPLTLARAGRWRRRSGRWGREVEVEKDVPSATRSAGRWRRRGGRWGREVEVEEDVPWPLAPQGGAPPAAHAVGRCDRHARVSCGCRMDKEKNVYEEFNLSGPKYGGNLA
jgi:hypothetical protein